MHGTQTIMAKRRKRYAVREVERPPGPTPERIAKAGEAFDVGHHGTVTLRDSPLEWMERRGVISTSLYNVGSKYRHHWYHAGLLPSVGSIDLNRIFGEPGGNVGMPSSEMQAHHRQQYRSAQREIGMQIGRVLDNVICLEFSLVDAGQLLGWKDEKQARAVATAFVRDGLERLRTLWGMA